MRRTPRTRIRLTARGVGVLTACILLTIAAYWERESLLLVPGAMCLGVLGFAAFWAFWQRGGVQLRAGRLATEGEDVLAAITAGPAAAGAAWRSLSLPQGIDDHTGPSSGLLDEQGGGVVSLGAQPRGRWPLPQVAVTTRDPFGVFERIAVSDEEVELVVGPRVTEVAAAVLGSVAVSGASRGAADGARLSHSTATSDSVDAMVREWRPGDPLGRVHWRQSTKRGQLMVRQEESPVSRALRVVIETAAASHLSFEADDRLARAACSLVCALARSTSHGELLVRETGRASLARDVPWHERWEAVAAFAGFESREGGGEREPAVAHVVALAEAQPPVGAMRPGSTLWLVVRERDPARAEAVSRAIAQVRAAGGHSVAVRVWVDGRGPEGAA